MTAPRIVITGGSGFIGSHLVDALAQQPCNILNIDVARPRSADHQRFWSYCDVKNFESLQDIVLPFRPTHVIHLAAKANLRGTTVADYPDNVQGTENVVRCVNKIDTVVRFVHASTQYVVRPGICPTREDEFVPYTAYGESKAESECIVRRDCARCWVILRPTNIWGPRHPHFPKELWSYLKHRVYLHPGHRSITKFYGYVGNAIDQITMLALQAPDADVCGKVYYVTDPPIDSADWMRGFSIALAGKDIRRVPLPIWRFLATVGDGLGRLGIRFPMTSARMFRLTVDERLPYERTREICGSPRISLEEGIRRSVEWYLADGASSSVHDRLS